MKTPGKQQGPKTQKARHQGRVPAAAAARDYQDHILRARGAFLEPHLHSAQDADESVCIVLIGYAMGDAAAAGLIRQRTDVAGMVRDLERPQVIELAISIMGDKGRDQATRTPKKLAA